MGSRLGNGISPGFLAFVEGCSTSYRPSLNPSYFSGKILLLLVCELCKAHFSGKILLLLVCELCKAHENV